MSFFVLTRTDFIFFIFTNIFLLFLIQFGVFCAHSFRDVCFSKHVILMHFDRRFTFSSLFVEIRINSDIACVFSIEGSRNKFASTESRKNIIHEQKKFEINGRMFFEKCLKFWIWKHNNLKHDLKHKKMFWLMKFRFRFRMKSSKSIVSILTTSSIPQCPKKRRNWWWNIIIDLTIVTTNSRHNSVDLNRLKSHLNQIWKRIQIY